jgi:hypothetical protein
MARCVFRKGEQSQFLHSSLDTLQIDSEELGKLINLSGRTIRDWMREKYLASYDSIEKIANISRIEVPKIIELRENWWSGRVYGRKGALRRTKLFGPLQTLEGRRKGGVNSWKMRRGNPELFHSLGCITANRFSYPSRDNSNFAEFIGIVLGDGGLSRNQLHISLNRSADKRYIPYVKKLITTLFGYTPRYLFRKESCALDLVVTGVDFISFLLNSGLVRGNKVHLQVDVPDWIKNNPQLSKSCVRGLIDTDGCMYINRYKIRDKWYKYRKLAFSNHSQPLLQFVQNTLLVNGFHATLHPRKDVRLSRDAETVKYLGVIGTSNPRLLRFHN